MTSTPDLSVLKPLAAEIEAAIQETPIRLGSNDWGTMLGSAILARVAAYMGHTLGPDAPILAEIQAERERQDARFGEQNHPDGTGLPGDDYAAQLVRQNCDQATKDGRLTWRHILAEEQQEALAESDPVKLRAELVQVAAVAANWIAAIDRRTARSR